MDSRVWCQYCGRPAFLNPGDDPVLRQHKGFNPGSSRDRWTACRASGRTQATARLMRANKDAGRDPWRNEDGTAVPLGPPDRNGPAVPGAI